MSKLVKNVLALVACIVVGFVIIHKQIENYILDYSISRTTSHMINFVSCEGTHPFLRLWGCKNDLLEAAKWSGTVWYLYHHGYGTEARRHDAKANMCLVSVTITGKLAYLHKVFDKIPGHERLPEHTNHWINVCH